MVVEMMMMMMTMMIPMKSSSMMVTMATISPLREEFHRQISPCRRAFLSLLFSIPQRRRKDSSMIPRVLGFRRGNVRRRGAPEVGQGLLTLARRGQGWARAWAW